MSATAINSKKGTSVTTYTPSKTFTKIVDNNNPTAPPKTTTHIFANGQEVSTIENVDGKSAPNFVATDHLKSTQVITDATGAPIEVQDYAPFGALTLNNKTGLYDSQRKYIGQEFDQDTGLSYLNARYYNSNIGRFISQDPMFWNFDQSWLSDPQNQNSYSYARNNPITMSDPSGKWAEVGIKDITLFSISVPYFGNFDFKIPGAHGDIKIHSEPGADFSKYGEGGNGAID